MATSKQIEQPPPYTVIALVVTVALCAAALYFQWPVAVIALFGVLAAASLSRNPVLTGPKDPQTQYPTVGNAGEQQALNRHRFWRMVPSKLFTCGPFWPLTTNMVAALGVGMLAYTLPYEGAGGLLQLVDAAGAMPFLPWVNGLLSALIVAGFGAALRSRDPENGTMPPTEIVSFVKQATPNNGKTFGLFVLAVSASLLVGLGLSWWISAADWYLIYPGAIAGVGAALLVFAMIAHLAMVAETRKPWLEMCEARATWAARWPSMPKLKDTPQLIGHRRLGEDQEVWIDEFVAPAMQGAKYWTEKPVPDGIEQLMPSNTMVAFLSVPDVAGDGSPITLSRSATKFRVITWNGDRPLDITDPKIDRELLSVWLDLKVSASCAAAWGSIFSLIPLHEPEALHVERETWTGSETAAWKVEYGVLQGTNLPGSMPEMVSSAQLALGHDVEVLPIGTSMYLGAITADTTELKDDSILAELEAEQESQAWEKRWKDITGPGMQAPTYFPDHDADEQLDDRTVIFSRLFGAPAGLSAKDYFAKATPDRIQSGLKGASWSTASFYVDPHSKKRYPHLMQIMWSEQQIPLNPARITPTENSRAATWAITGAINAAFLGAKLQRPEVMSVKPLTSRQSRGHIWEATLALLDGMTLADVRKSQQKLMAALEGCEWLRVGASTRGCRILFGAMPSARRTWASRDAETSARKLDWEQHFIDSKIKNMREETPQLLDVAPLPKNDLVREYRFKMPAGLSISDVRKETGKLMSTTGNGFLDIRQGATPAEMIIQAAEESPMPSLAFFNWDEVHESKAVPFATNIQGEPLAYDPLTDPHIVILGASGSGKAQPLSTRIPVPVSEKFPVGWATVGTLSEGDRVLTPNGGTAEIIGFSDEREEPVYVFELSDGQEVRSSGHHIWPVQDASGRAGIGGKRAEVSQKTRDNLLRQAVRFRAVAAAARPGAAATSKTIAELAGVNTSVLHNAGVLHEVLGRRVLMPSNTRSREYLMDDVLRQAKRAIHFKGQFVFAGQTWSAAELDDLELSGEWLSARSIAEVFSRSDVTDRTSRDAAKQVIQCASPKAREGVERTSTLAYPVNEVMQLLAQVFEERAEGHAGDPTRLMHAEDIARTVQSDGGASNWSIELANPACGSDADLPLDPYTFGVWLGDGASYGGAVTTMDEEIVESITASGFPLRRVESKGTDSLASTYHFDGLWEAIKSIGLEQVPAGDRSWKLDKRVPAAYLRASSSQRLALLQGLMDSDGTISKSGSCEFSVSHRGLAEDTLELLRSIGIKAAMTDGESACRNAEGEKVVTGIRYRIKFTTDLQVFRLQRQAERLPDRVRATQRRVYITGVRVEEPEMQRCLRLDTTEHQFLTDGFVRTHNSAMLQSLLTPAAIQGYEMHIFDKPKGAADFQYLVPYAKQVATEYVTIAAALENIYREVERRKELNQKYGASRVRNLPDEVRPPHMIVIIDEFTSTIKPELLDKVTGDETEDQLREREIAVRTNQYKGRIGAAVGKIMREARSAGVSMLVAGQTLSADEMKASPALGNIKNQAAVILLGKASFGQRASAFKNVELAPELGESVPKGRGIFESSEGAPTMFQAWYGADFAEYETGPQAEAAHLANMVEQISAVREPETEQLFDDDLRPDESEIRTFGEIIQDPADGGEAVSEEVIDMGELDLDISFDDLDLDLDLSDTDSAEQFTLDEESTTIDLSAESAVGAAGEPEPTAMSDEPVFTIPSPAPEPDHMFFDGQDEIPFDEPEPLPAPEGLLDESNSMEAKPESLETTADQALDAGIFQRRQFNRPSMADDLFG